MIKNQHHKVQKISDVQRNYKMIGRTNKKAY